MTRKVIILDLEATLLWMRDVMVETLGKEAKPSKEECTKVLLDCVLEVTYDPKTAFVNGCWKNAGINNCESLGEKYGFIGEHLYDLINANEEFQEHLNQVYDALGENPYHTWTINKTKKNLYALESLGDFRILEWERDHMRNGKYHKKPLKN